MSPADDVFEAPPGGFRFGPVHPGRALADELKARDLSAHALALKLRVPANRITEIIQGKRGISAETALRLGRYFGTGAPSGWLFKPIRSGNGRARVGSQDRGGGGAGS